jgi:hypothetical protein
MDVMVANGIKPSQRFQVVLPCNSAHSIDDSTKTTPWHRACSDERVPMQSSVRPEFVSLRVSAYDPSVAPVRSLARLAFSVVREQINSIAALAWLVRGTHRRSSNSREEELW